MKNQRLPIKDRLALLFTLFILPVLLWLRARLSGLATLAALLLVLYLLMQIPQQLTGAGIEPVPPTRVVPTLFPTLTATPVWPAELPAGSGSGLPWCDITGPDGKTAREKGDRCIDTRKGSSP